jgi:hypothetical protein
MNPRVARSAELLLPHVASAASMRFGFHFFTAATCASRAAARGSRDSVR